MLEKTGNVAALARLEQADAELRAALAELHDVGAYSPRSRT
jgi:hypothetical protein